MSVLKRTMSAFLRVQIVWINSVQVFELFGRSSNWTSEPSELHRRLAAFVLLWSWTQFAFSGSWYWKYLPGLQNPEKSWACPLGLFRHYKWKVSANELVIKKLNRSCSDASLVLRRSNLPVRSCYWPPLEFKLATLNFIDMSAKGDCLCYNTELVICQIVWKWTHQKAYKSTR